MNFHIKEIVYINYKAWNAITKETHLKQSKKAY